MDNTTKKKFLRFYRGTSMSGTFRSGDCLIFKTIRLTELHAGDVIIFCKKDGGQKSQVRGDEDPGEVHQMDETQPAIELVHRVIALIDGGVVTRGDHNALPDAGLVNADNLVGIVTQLERDRKVYLVYGGWMGLLRTSLLRIWNFYLRRIFAVIGRPPYQWLAGRNWAIKFWKPRIIKIHLTNADGTVYKFTAQGQIVARWWPARNHFECQKPYDLILRRENLPR